VKNAKKVTVPAVRLNLHQERILTYIATHGRDGRAIPLGELVSLFEDVARDGLKATQYTARSRASAFATNSLRKLRATGLVTMAAQGVYTVSAEGLALHRTLNRKRAK
jgi:hypothetical protein